jgi:hypothetical protein
MFQLESFSTGMNIVNVLKKRGNALNLFLPPLTLQNLDSRTERALHRMAGANLGREPSPATTVVPGERRRGHAATNSWPHPLPETA